MSALIYYMNANFVCCILDSAQLSALLFPVFIYYILCYPSNFIRFLKFFDIIFCIVFFLLFVVFWLLLLLQTYFSNWNNWILSDQRILFCIFHSKFVIDRNLDFRYSHIRYACRLFKLSTHRTNTRLSDFCSHQWQRTHYSQLLESHASCYPAIATCSWSRNSVRYRQLLCKSQSIMNRYHHYFCWWLQLYLYQWVSRQHSYQGWTMCIDNKT